MNEEIAYLIILRCTNNDQIRNLRGYLDKYKWFNLINPTGHVMHQQFNIQQLYVLPTLYLRVLYLSENKQRLVTFTA